MTRWLDDTEQRAWRGYLDMNAELTARLHRRLQADSGLSLADFDVLVKLTDQPQPRLRAGELAEALQWEKSRLSHHLARMQKRGLVARQDCPDDGRGAFVVLTDQGRAAIDQAAPAHVETVRDLVFDQLTTEEVAALTSITDRVRARLDATA
ncbi:MarR family winged helix-turn-helix transcriptional regulator [Prauserella cavernicola]|uniref:MarR family transcriptional regulator n=1 Tax=Prauserella cavernicola TaxID=2800127 RepID=A0A934QWJ3_9PSEU|nr:MarR family transcriptional regulator [Prauserella cavernicola]MBK1787700.1 MarR family transcriptional regulator [Prauserella cavernicola]